MTERPPDEVAQRLTERGTKVSGANVEAVSGALNRAFGVDIRYGAAVENIRRIIADDLVTVSTKLVGVAEKRPSFHGPRKLIGRIERVVKDERSTEERRNLIGLTCFIDVTGTKLASLVLKDDLPAEMYGAALDVMVRSLGPSWADGVPARGD